MNKIGLKNYSIDHKIKKMTLKTSIILQLEQRTTSIENLSPYST